MNITNLLNKSIFTSICVAMTYMSAGLQAQPLADVEVAIADGPIVDTVVTYDAKTFPGISCEAQATVEIDQFLNVQFSMFNANPGRRSVVCPIVRDKTQNTNGTYAAYVNVYNPANRTIDCALYSYDQFGALVDSDFNSTSSSGNQSIYLDVDASVARGYYAISCELPNSGGILSYEWREYIDTDRESNLSPF